MMKSVISRNTCPLCLQVKTKLFRLDDIYKHFIENSIHKEIQYIPQEDYNACNICLYLVSKSFDFIQRICNTQKIIHELLVTNNCEELTVPILENINRDEMGLTKFCTATVAIVDINGSCDNGYLLTKSEEELSNVKSEESNKIEVSVDIKGECETQDNSKFSNFIEININQDEYIEGVDRCKYLSDDCKPYDHMEVFTEAYKPSHTFGLEKLSETMNNTEVIICSSKNVKEEFNYPVVAKKKIMKRTKIKTDKGSAPFLPTAMNAGLEETIKNVKEEFNHTVIAKNKRLKCTKIKTDKSSVPFVPVAMNTGPTQPRPRRSIPSSTQNKRSRKKANAEYCPDSTSHSEDSVYDSFDDEGKRIRRLEDNRVYPMKCDHCDYNIPKRAEHYRHYVFEHPNVDYPYSAEKTTCTICGKLITVAKIRSHELNHTKMKVKCTECPRVFDNQRRMAKHRWEYHRSKSFTCDYCSKTFNQRHDLIRHLRIHTGEKPFKCHICDAAFAHSGNRSHHMRSTHQNINIVPNQRNKKETKSTRA